ncbi:MAG TPA: GlsB/YeaQ/YmgE family stress response membrane protein [Alphaproteobacteria bacterium]|nr:GlsB/YeaQ/YmgE family stress response membrane protein [Alphaproteobacteria bacterium]
MEELLGVLLNLADDLAVAAIAGWVAGRIVGGKAPSLMASLVFGLMGWLVGQGLLSVLGAGLFGLPMLLVSFMTALGGAVLLWLSLPLLKRG